MGKEMQGTREKIIRVAITLMWEQSYQGTSVDTLCSRAGVRKGSFYHFFTSKTDLAIAAIEAAWDKTRKSIFDPIFDDEAPGMAQLNRLIDKVEGIQTALLNEKGAYLGCPFGNLGQEMATKDEAIRQATQQVFDAHCKYIARALNRAQAEGAIPAGDNAQRARNIFALLEGALLLTKVAKDPAAFRPIASAMSSIAVCET